MDLTIIRNQASSSSSRNSQSQQDRVPEILPLLPRSQNVPHVQRQRDNQARVRAPPMTNAERQKRYRERVRNRSIRPRQEFDQSHTPVQSSLLQRNPIFDNFWKKATTHFDETFKENRFGHACNVCDRLWFEKDLKKVKPAHLSTLEAEFGRDCATFRLCSNCKRVLDRNKIPQNSITNGFEYPDVPPGLPPLDQISTRLISPRIPFMAIRRLRRDGAYGIIGQVINVPVDVDTMVRQLPRQLDDDYAFNVSIKRKLIHKSSYLTGYVSKRVIKSWLTYLVRQPLYRHYNIQVDEAFQYSTSEEDSEIDQQESNDLVEEINCQTESESLIARQQTLLWNEENVLDIAPAERRQPLNLIFDHHAEELSFPQIYYGVGRSFNLNVRVTPYMIANSEIRRRDRRGVSPDHILYMAMKILRLRVVDGIRASFRCVRETENITRRMIEDPKFLEDCVEKNFSFLKSIPNSINYWMSRKTDLFAMMRQLGKPTMFLTLSANEVKWPNLIELLYKLRNGDSENSQIDIFETLDKSSCAELVNEDPVTCCVYFDKLVDVIMSMLRTKFSHNPFGKYRILDHFLRIEFQHRGSPHAHILLWLENDPHESISEDMPLTLQLITDLCSVNKDDLPHNTYANQVHKHTFTCTKRGETSCRFKIPYWPMKQTRILLPLAPNYNGLQELKKTAKKARNLLEVKIYNSIDSFLDDIRMDEKGYLDMIRSTISRPIVCFKRKMCEIMTNTFNPWIAGVLNSNMDLQFILDEYSCAQYVVDYVNKSNRGMSNLHREIVKLSETHPEITHESLLKKIGSKILNTVELSAQEAAWYLLRQHMSSCSRDVVFVPTYWPCERQKSYKTRSQLEQSKIDPNSTDIWTKSIVQRYEERPNELSSLCLADFATCYSLKTRSTMQTDEDFDMDEIVEAPQVSFTAQIGNYYQREFSRVLSFRGYDSKDVKNFRREMVMLFVPFRNEQRDVLDRNKYLEIYSTRILDIAAKKKEYMSGCDIEQIMNEIRQAEENPVDESALDVIVEREEFVRGVLNDGDQENFDDFNNGSISNTISAVRTRANIMTKEEYCYAMQTTNERQRELILEFIHRLNTPNSSPIQVFFTGPAGCGKTYVLKLIMETLNRYSQSQNVLSNSYVACASTGKASVGINGTTVHSAFHLTQSRRQGPIAREKLHNFRQLFANVRCVILDEVSMIGSDLLHKFNQRLQQITAELDENFGGMNMVFCGDFRQLPPVIATPVYRGSKDHLEGALLWQSLDYFNLDQVMRQSDASFSTILTKIGEGSALNMAESQIIESRFCSEQWCDENLPGVVRLFHQNHMVNSYNSKVIINGLQTVAIDSFIGYSNNNELATSRSKLHRMATMETGGLPYCIPLATGYPYMLTSNSDTEDGLVNGAIGMLRFIENLSTDAGQDQQAKLRVWLEFEEGRIGIKARVKFRPAIVSSRGVIHSNWTPISMKTASISLGNTVRCKRTQLPLTPACAITIHKSQGGTFDKAVVLYEKSQQNQLVYVALSRVKSIEGLFLINPKDDRTFYHKKESTSPTMKEIKDEYARLNSHPLGTITNLICNFLGDSRHEDQLNLCTINAQSLVAHATDIATDKVLTRSDILAITETWMDSSSPIDIDGYVLISCSNQPNGLHQRQSQDRHPIQTRRTAGGVAIYLKADSPICCQLAAPDVPNWRVSCDSCVGDIAFAEVTINEKCKLILSCIYVHPGSSKANIEMFLSYALADYCNETRRSSAHADVDIETPFILTGDFNCNVQDDNWIIAMMRQKFGLSYVNCLEPTTLGNTIIDLTFSRGLVATCMPFVSYFSYHRPLFNKILLEQ